MELKCIDEVHVVFTESDDFKKLLNQKDEYVVLHSGGESSDVHPKILGMVSKYFNTYFEWHMDVREVDLEENKDQVKDYQSMSIVVHYANTGILSFSSLNVEKLYQVAHYIECPFVIEECEKVIIEIMQNKDASEILSMINPYDKFQSTKVLKAICEYVSENFVQLSTEILKLCEHDFDLLFSNENLSVFRQGIPVDNPDFVLFEIVNAYFKSKENCKLHRKLLECVDQKYFSNCKRNIEFGDESYGLSAKELLKYSNFDGGIRSDVVCSEIYRLTNDRLQKISLWFVDWDGVAVLGGMIILYKSGKTVECNKKPKKCISEAELFLDEGEVVTAVDLYLGCLVKDLSFKTNFGRDFGPFCKRRIGPWGFVRKEMSLGEHSYLHSLRCTIVQLRYHSAISCLNFAWITYPCDELKEKSIRKKFMRDDYRATSEGNTAQIGDYITRDMRRDSMYRSDVEVDGAISYDSISMFQIEGPDRIYL